MADPEAYEESLTSLQTSPAWLPTTFNMKTELPLFVSYFQQREKKCVEFSFLNFTLRP